MESKLKIYVLLSIALLSISSASILVILSDASAAACAFWRVLIASLIIWTWIYLRGSLNDVLSMSMKEFLLCVFSGVLLGSHFVAWMESLFIVPVSVSTTVVVTYPIFTALADALVFKKPPKGIQIAGLLLGLLGVSLFTHPYVLGNYSVLGVFMALLGSVFAAGYFSIGKFVRRSTGVLAYAAVTYLSAAISVGTYALLTGENIINYPPRSFLYFVLLALVPMIGGHTVMNYVLRFLRTSSVTSIALGEPVGATILAYFIIKQLVDLPKIGAMALTIASIALIVSKEELPTES